jgi:hypothetical protein
MPRIYESNSDPLDFCRAHFPTRKVAEELYGHSGDGPDGRGDCFDYDSDHPDYDSDEYRCERCGVVLLTEQDA